MDRPEWHTPKGERRRAELLRAAMTVIGQRGYAGATQRAIAAEAGVPPASTHYFFDSIEDLVQQAAMQYLQERVDLYEARLEEFAAGDRSPAEGCREVAELLTAVGAESRAAQFEIYLNARRQPALQATVLEAIARLEGLASRLLDTMAVPDPDTWASAFLAMGDGFALRGVAGAPAGVDALEQALLAIVVAARRDDAAATAASASAPGQHRRPDLDDHP